MTDPTDPTDPATDPVDAELRAVRRAHTSSICMKASKSGAGAPSSATVGSGAPERSAKRVSWSAGEGASGPGVRGEGVVTGGYPAARAAGRTARLTDNPYYP